MLRAWFENVNILSKGGVARLFLSFRNKLYLSETWQKCDQTGNVTMIYGSEISSFRVSIYHRVLSQYIDITLHPFNNLVETFKKIPFMWITQVWL